MNYAETGGHAHERKNLTNVLAHQNTHIPTNSLSTLARKTSSSITTNSIYREVLLPAKQEREEKQDQPTQSVVVECSEMK